mmetsp:Transcript_38632/g.74049  ORF Transcript_38632/g.74049 Transcript_38632/m.74049 type:complete len:91 (+) Transcript_38632:207-479(+)|eukprot:CAMPEP_0114250364 /NCGR_PEP_ID=MMETSP0058-20121206/14658_1 /TAXON_ID=36894 /ORGANISM="Pyramimonas parkeae, CCMP726" /LENGTH=90 /DNA_ID=CAMNT_0001364015 /DNA_START=204 /DNA_END=476 /DNA_ORIENTATION=+
MGRGSEDASKLKGLKGLSNAPSKDKPKPPPENLTTFTFGQDGSPISISGYCPLTTDGGIQACEWTVSMKNKKAADEKSQYTTVPEFRIQF